MPRYSAQFLSQLLARRDYSALVGLQSVALGWEGYDARVPSFGWPHPIFVIFEILTWFAQADRSGVWTYYESTPVSRLDCALATLDMLKAVELRQQYAYGKMHWQDTEAIAKLDRWLRENERAIIEWAFATLAEHPAELALVSS